MNNINESDDLFMIESVIVTSSFFKPKQCLVGSRYNVTFYISCFLEFCITTDLHLFLYIPGIWSSILHPVPSCALSIINLLFANEHCCTFDIRKKEIIFVGTWKHILKACVLFIAMLFI